MAVLFTKAISNTKANLVCEYKQNSQDIANNRTNVTVTLKIVSTGYYLNGTSVIYLNGTKYTPYINVPNGGSQTVATQTYNIQHNADGTGRISVNGSCNIATGSFTASGSGSANLSTIPRASQPSLITWPNSTYDITLGNKVTIHFNRKSPTFKHKIQMLFWGYDPYLISEPIDGENWEWDTSLFEDEMYKKMPDVNKKQGTIRLYTYNGNTLIGSKDVLFGANITNANPIFNNFNYECIDDKTLNLTGNKTTVIKGFSNVKAIVTQENKAIAQKYATMSKYKFVCGNDQIEVPYSNTDTVEMLLEQIDNVTMNVYAIDSRGNSTMLNKTFDNFINYENIKIGEMSTNRQNGVDTQTTLVYKGTFWNDTFGSVKNSIKEAKYEYKIVDSSDWKQGITPIIPTKNDTQNFDFNGLIAGDLEALGFTLSESFNIKATISDELSSYSYETILNTGKPNIAIAKDGIAIGRPYDKESGGKIQGLYKVGDIFISTVKENPSLMYGGTWVLYAKGQTLVGIDESQSEFNESEKTGGEKKHTMIIAELAKHNHRGNPVYYTYNTSHKHSGMSGKLAEAPADGATGGVYASNDLVGSNQPFNILQPYITVYIWKKVL